MAWVSFLGTWIATSLWFAFDVPSWDFFPTVGPVTTTEIAKEVGISEGSIFKRSAG